MFLNGKVSGIQRFGRGSIAQGLEHLAEWSLVFCVDLSEGRYSVFQADLGLQPRGKIASELIDWSVVLSRQTVVETRHTILVVEGGEGWK